MQIHGEHSVGSRLFKKVGDQLGGYRVSRARFPVLSRIAEIRHNHRQLVAGRAFESVNHNEQLHKIVVYGSACGLNHENVAAAHRFLNVYANFSVGKASGFKLSQGQFQPVGNSFGKVGTSVSRENLDRAVRHIYHCHTSTFVLVFCNSILKPRKLFVK